MKKKQKPFQPQPDPEEKLREIGSYLRQMRKDKSLSLEEIAAETKIQLRLLRAIEEARIEVLPEPIYIKGFIKQFADALDEDGEEIASSFPTWQNRVFIKPYWLYLNPGQLRPIHLYLLYIFIVIGAVNGLSYVVNQSAMRANVGETSQEQIDKLISKNNETATSDTLTEVSQSNETDMPVRVGVKLKSPSWVRIVADGKTEFEGVLKEGEQRIWMANEQITIAAGNAGGVLVAFNEEKAKELGKPGQLQKVTFEADAKIN